jgi:hypothetical protein
MKSNDLRQLHFHEFLTFTNMHLGTVPCYISFVIQRDVDGTDYDLLSPVR